MIITNNLCYDLVALIVTLVVGGIAFMKWRFTYWEKQGVPTLPPKIPFGNFIDLILGRASFGELFTNVYDIFKPKGYRHCGFYFGASPAYVPIDPEIIKHIIQTDFAHFTGHGGYVDEEIDPLSGHLFNLDGVKWRNLRVKLTPTFTSGKMRMMFQTLADVSVTLKELMDKSAEESTSVDIRDVLSRFGTDIISTVAFGLEVNSLKNPDVPFRYYGKKAVEMDIWDNIKIFKQVLLPPKLLRLMRHKFTKSDVEKFFMETIKDTVEYREKNKVHRKDFMHLLLQLKNRGTVSDDDKITDDTGKTNEISLNMNELSAQAHVFFTAGYETSSTTVTFALCELAMNPDVQEKARKEIQKVLAEHDNQLTYEGIMQMTYLEKIVYETLRKYPPLPILLRQCNKDYTVPNTNVHIKKGTGVIIPVLGLHKDPEYYPNPEAFEPERFSEENKKTRPAFTWLPFGDGPRICIGMRFGIVQSKVALTTFLNNYHVTLNKKTSLPITFDKRSFVSKVAGGVWLDLKKLK